MASKKLYEDVASALSDLSLAPADHEVVVAVLSLAFERDNPRFDVEKFAEAAAPANKLLAIDAETLTRLVADYIVAGFEEGAADAPGKRPSVDSVLEIARDSVVKRLSAES